MAVYSGPDVEAACLKLQDDFGLDVNMLLFCCWAGSLGVSLDKARLQSVLDAVAEWQSQIILPLRGVRQLLKSTEFTGLPEDERESCRNMVKAAELRAEKNQQTILAANLPPAGETQSDRSVMLANLEAYWSLQNSDGGDTPNDFWAVIVESA